MSVAGVCSMDNLKKSELQLVQQLKAAVAPQVQKHAHLRWFCNDWTYVRYLRARSWHLGNATKMLKETLAWRCQYKPHDIKWEDVQEEGVTGKQMIMPAVDTERRPVVFMRPRLQNTTEHERQIKHLIYHLEHASRMADELGVGKMCWLLDFEGYSSKNSPPMKVTMHVLHVLQNHFPERLGTAVCYHAPWLFSMTWKAVSPFIDPVTKKKIYFIEGSAGDKQMAQLFDMDHIETCMGGRHAGFIYDHAAYGTRMEAEEVRMRAQIAAIQSEMDGTSAGNAPAEATEYAGGAEADCDYTAAADATVSDWLSANMGEMGLEDGQPATPGYAYEDNGYPGSGVTPAGSVSRSGSAGVEEATGSDFLALARPSDPSNPQYDASVHAAVGIASRNPSESTGAKDGAARPGEEPSDVFFDCDEEFTSA